MLSMYEIHAVTNELTIVCYISMYNNNCVQKAIIALSYAIWLTTM